MLVFPPAMWTAGTQLPDPDEYYPCDESSDTSDLLAGIGSFDITVVGSPDAENTNKKFSALDYWRESTSGGAHWRINNTVHESVWDYGHFTDGLWAMAGWVKPADSNNFLRIGYMSSAPYLELTNNSGVMRLRVSQDDASAITADSTVTLTVDGSVWHGFVIQIKDDAIAISVDNETLVETSVGSGRTIGAQDAGSDIQIGRGVTGGWSGLAVWNGIELSAAQRTLWDDGYYWNGSIWVNG